ncbi:hypothetical protein [Rathayibacter sp. VKM Ac-2630]|uniref:hypothetical protein n=1 Tax=Rathayibacter sp. VKM Ac-2630 TaxID=1938617 RepID=UPI0009814800|nr:hypothetical protein [Rathayibacter sp. VKM Ac-2630]OOB90278.1 hypothetical protein B0T42_12310 [Rathayibacter sp. VKM Ac-2630]
MAATVTTVPPAPALNNTDWRGWAAAATTAIQELQVGGIAEQSVGFLNAADPKWKLTSFDPDAETPVANDATALYAEAHRTKKAILAPHRYLVAETTAGSNFNDKNMHVIGVGGGGFFGQGGTIVRQIIAPSPGVTVSAFKEAVVGGDGVNTDGKHASNFIDVPAADIPKFRADTAWQIVASGATKSTTSDYRSGFYTWALPGTVVHDLLSSGDTPLSSGKPVMAEAVAILGVTYLLSSAASTLAENDKLTGATSKASMKIESFGADYNGSTNKRVTTRQVLGSFQVGENVLKGTTIVGKIAAAGQVITKGTTLYDWSKITAGKTIRKLGGSQKGYTPSALFPVGDYFSNLVSQLEDLTFDTVTDPNGVNQVRGAAVDIRGAVNGRYVGNIFKNGYRNAFRLASPYGGVVANNQVLALPNDATDEDAFGYGVEVEGTGQNLLVTGNVFTNVRHGFTTNPTGNSQFLSAVGDTLRHGTQRFLFVTFNKTFDTYAPGFDTHHGADSIYFIGNIGNGVISGGQKDAGKSVFQTRSTNTWYIGNKSIGGIYGFTDATAGFTVPQGNPDPNTTGWVLKPVHSRSTYIGNDAWGYEEVGYRQGLAAESPFHSAVYHDNGFDDGGRSATRYQTVGMRLTGVDTWISGTRTGRNTLAMFDIVPGGYWKDGDPGPKPKVPVTAHIAFIGPMFADFSRNETDSTKLIRMTSHETEGVINLVLDGNVSVAKKAGVTGMPEAWVTHVSGKGTIKHSSPKITVLNGTGDIPALKISGGTVTKKTLPSTTFA